MKLEFSLQIFRRKSTQVSKFMKIRPVGAELFHVNGRTDGQADVMKLTVAFRNFTNSSKSDGVLSSGPI